MSRSQQQSRASSPAPDTKSERATWSDRKDDYLVQQLQLQSDKGKRADTGWKKEAWAEVTKNFNKEFKVKYNTQSLKSRLDLVPVQNASGLSSDCFCIDEKGFQGLQIP
jgi:hypothetical protein